VAATPESAVKARCVEVLKRYGAYYFFPAQNGYGRAGVPDIIVCFMGRFLAIECKAGKNKLHPLQEREMAAIHAAEGVALEIREDNIHDLERVLQQWT
jgi:hypothetical protein